MEKIMKSLVRRALGVGLAQFLFLSATSFSQSKRPITAEDCVKVRSLNPDDLSGAIRMNRQGTNVTYVVKAPNIAENRNDDQLFVKDLTEGASAQPRLLATATAVTNIQWLRDGKHFSVLLNTSTGHEIAEFDARTGEHTAWIHSEDDVREYSIDSEGKVLVFAAEVSNRESQSLEFTPEQRARGYRVPPFVDSTGNLQKRTLFIAKRSSNGNWNAPVPLKIRLPFSSDAVEQVPYSVSLHLSMSPDGSQFLFNYVNRAGLPQDWNEDPTVHATTQAGIPGIVITALYHLSNDSATVPLRSAGATQVPLWNDDGMSYITFAFSPVGSSWAKEDERAHKTFTSAGSHMFWVRPSTADVELIPAQVSDTRDRALLFWNDLTHTIGVRTKQNLIEFFVQQENGWHSQSSIQLPFEHFPHYAQLASDGKTVVGDFQSTITPPELFLFDVHSKTTKIFQILNPEFAFLDLAPVREVHWSTSTGFAVSGLLLLPTHFEPSGKYPLVVATKFSRGDFACDADAFHSPSFAPQPIANSGMMYLMGYTPENADPSAETAYYPRGYPGGVAEAAFYMDIWDSAVDSLAAQGLVDTSKVGIIGFSRTGWHTEFLLAHSKHRFLAATVADNIQYNLSEYWLYFSHSVGPAFESIYGGPPYGDGLKNWIKYSISFNLENFHTPLLLEQNGYGVIPDRTSIPWAIATSAEVFTGLTRLNKPVEMYFYPDEQHQPDHPQARLASLQRNVDWYRFWLLGAEREHHPDDPDLYVRWNHLKALEAADAPATANRSRSIPHRPI
jgi:dipeptidyl aminopeptidase/acylaminoacyl peptidase